MFTKLTKISLESLRACYVDECVVASPTHFSDFWARDTLWAVPGMIVAGDTDRVRACLAYFLAHVDHKGRVPRKIMREYTLIKYLFSIKRARMAPRPVYTGLVPPFSTMDSAPLLIIAFESYVEATRDYDFAEAHYDTVQRIMQRHKECMREGLVPEYLLGNWMDTVFKWGPVLYTNVLSVRAWESMVTIAQIAGRDDHTDVYVARARRMKRTVRRAFWRETHFIDESRHRGDDVFDLAGNTLAVLWGIADIAQAKMICRQLHDLTRAGTCVPAVPDAHPWYKINPLVRLLGIGDYHTQTSWMWINALVATTLHKSGYKQDAQELFEEIEHIIVRDGAVGETYDADTTLPYKKRFWKSASPFAWSGGIVLSSLSMCGYITHQKKIVKQEQRIC